MRTLVPSSIRSVAWPAAPSQTSAFGAWPLVCRQGWKWSEMAAMSKPSRSASTVEVTSSRGPNCSAEAFQP